MDWKEDYIKRLDKLDVSSEEILDAIELKNSNLPQNLYKYRPPTEDAIKNLKSDTVWLNSPAEYNDPFEFAEYIDFERSRAVSENLLSTDELTEINNRIHLDIRTTNLLGLLLPASTISRLQEVQENVFKKHHSNIQNQVIQNRQDLMKVSSFCESPNNILMWGHYARCHTGFCIEYNIGRWHLNDIRRKLLHPVVYIDDIYESTDHFIKQMAHGSFNFMYPILSGTRKYKQWEYEREWRLIIPVGVTFLKRDYTMDCQSKVYIGCRMKDDFRERIIDICRRGGIEIYQSKPSVNEYNLEFERIE